MNYSPQQQSINNTSLLASSPDPTECICKGSGWRLSNYDTWEQCSYTAHREGNERHPEDAMLDDYYESLGWERCEPTKAAK